MKLTLVCFVFGLCALALANDMGGFYFMGVSFENENAFEAINFCFRLLTVYRVTKRTSRTRS